MLLSRYFLPILKENPVDAQIISHQLMLRSGMIRQHVAGIYSWLPIGLKVLKNVENIVRYHLDQSGCLELLMPCVQPANLWIESGRFDDYGKEMLRFKDRHDNDLLFGPTNEEMITDLCRNNIQSYRDLPKNMYHIQWKFRDEIRPRFGVMRGREFLMKDGYSFDLSYEEAIKSYNLMYSTYCRIFADLGVKIIPVIADNGAIGGSLSHEFHIVASTGESNIYYDKKFDQLSLQELENLSNVESLYAVADEKYEADNCPVAPENLVSTHGIEVGHIFYFGTKYSDKMNAVVNNSNGELVKLEMGSYGIGISRLVAALIEASHDEKGIIWNKKIAPFKLSIINLMVGDEACNHLAMSLYNGCERNNIDALYDDTTQRAGAKFATHDLIGSPWQAIIGSKNASKGLIELKERASSHIKLVNIDELLNNLVNEMNVQ